MTSHREEVSILFGYIPGSIGRITEIHASYYSRNWRFGLFFEQRVARDLAEFLGRFEASRDGLWLAVLNDHIVGSIAIDGADEEEEGAHLRWFIVEPGQQSRGIGKALIEKALAFCKACRFKRVYLWTFEGLDVARSLYERNGFRLSRELENNQWGVTVREQMFELLLPG